MVEFWKNIGLKNWFFVGRSEKSCQFLPITKWPIDGENARRNNINGKIKGMWSLKAKKIKAASFQMLGRVGWSQRANRLKRPFRTWTQLSRVVVGSYQWRLCHLAGFVAPLTTMHLTDRLVYLISHACRCIPCWKQGSYFQLSLFPFTGKWVVTPFRTWTKHLRFHDCLVCMTCFTPIIYLYIHIIYTCNKKI